MGILKRCYRFLRYNEHKLLTIKAYILSAYYRFLVLNFKTAKIKKGWGVEGKESATDVDRSAYVYAKKVSYAVNQVCNKTKWESKCLIRALVAKKLLAEKGIDSTLYLGCKEENGKMVAHAWVRCGRAYITGGRGQNDGYIVVDKFRTWK